MVLSWSFWVARREGSDGSLANWRAWSMATIRMFNPVVLNDQASLHVGGRTNSSSPEPDDLAVPQKEVRTASLLTPDGGFQCWLVAGAEAQAPGRRITRE